MAYTTQAQVATVIDITVGDDLTGAIDTAHQLVTDCCLSYTVPYSDVKLELIERWLAAHCYAMNRPRASLESASGGGGGVSQQFEPSKAGFGLRETKYGSFAMSLDTGGNLALMQNTMDKRLGALPGGAPAASIRWAGKRRRWTGWCP